MRHWVAVALLSASWLWGLSYYHQSPWPRPAEMIVRRTATAATEVPGIDWGATLRAGCRLPLDYPAFSFWSAAVLLGAALMVSRRARLPSRAECAAAAVMVAPAVWLAAWPQKAAWLGLAAGAVLVAATGDRLRRAAGALIAAGAVLLAQGLTIWVYTALTGRNHDLPFALTKLVAAAVACLGATLGVYDSTIALFSMRETHRMAATWELLADPVSVAFLVGGLVLVAWRAWCEGDAPGCTRRWAIASGMLVVAMIVWLPVRAALLVALYLDDTLRTAYEMPLDAMKLLWSPWTHLALLAPPVLLAWRLTRPRPDAPPQATIAAPSPRPATAATAPKATDGSPAGAPRRRLAALPAGVAGLLVGAGVLALSAGVYWDPVGRRASGRVIVEEYHPDRTKIWERTDRPYDTTWYGHLSGYNYYCIYDYLSRYYDMSRLTRPIDDAALADCDVLILKTPTRRYAPEEIDAVLAFVRRGGGLLLIGEHTNVFGSGSYLNDVARRLGFEFRYDCLFGLDSVFDQTYVPPRVPHPVVQHMPAMEFATSCSIAPGWSVGRAVILETGLKNLTADYHVNNFYPRPIDRADMRYGAFVQLWSTRYGRGRVLAFTDSTIFSNFSTFEPGKSELMLGMVEWLNHRTGCPDPRWWLLPLGAVLVVSGGLVAVAKRGGWLVPLGAGALGWSVAAVAIPAAQRAAMPPPQPIRPMVRAVLDESLSTIKLPKNGFISGDDRGFGIFERWMLRLGYFTARREGTAVFDGQLAVFIFPEKPPSEEFRQALVEYVERGGKVLVVDSARNRRSTAGALLEPFGLRLIHPPRESGKSSPAQREEADGDQQPAGREAEPPSGGVQPGADALQPRVVDPRAPQVAGSISGELRSDRLPWTGVPVVDAVAVSGGTPLGQVDGKPVAAVARRGRGAVAVIGFGSRFSDANMGYTGDVEPDEALKKVYEVEFSLLRAIINDQW